MASTRKSAKPASNANEVSEFMRTLAHPLKAEIEAVRALLLAADATIQEGIKWNAPSFRVQEYFATVHLRNTKAVQIIFHLGAKARPDAKLTLDDPAGLLEWLAHDRATVKLNSLPDIQNHGAALQNIVRQWITHLT